MSSRGHEDYTSIEKAETNLYEVQKWAKLALVIVESSWKGTPGNFMRQWNCISDLGVMWVWIFFKTRKNNLCILLCVKYT